VVWIPVIGQPGFIDGSVFEPILVTHEELRAGVSRALESSGADRADALANLRAILCRHLNVTERVLYPMVRRAAGDAGEIAGENADRREVRALSVLDSSDDLDDDDIVLVRDEIEAHIEYDLNSVMPLLRESLDDQRLRVLGDALREARYTAPV
jgi:hypothetical protein